MNEQVKAWMETLSPDVKAKAFEIRTCILNYDKRIIEGWSYGMPSYKIKKNIFYFNMYQRHIGLYPHHQAIEIFKDELRDYKTSKGAIQIPLDAEIPFDLIRKILAFNIKNESN
jgi:uncharacterized protein YdhG (YjbR/CyaY superfamily)